MLSPAVCTVHVAVSLFWGKEASSPVENEIHQSATDCQLLTDGCSDACVEAAFFSAAAAELLSWGCDWRSAVQGIQSTEVCMYVEH